MLLGHMMHPLILPVIPLSHDGNAVCVCTVPSEEGREAGGGVLSVGRRGSEEGKGALSLGTEMKPA